MIMTVNIENVKPSILTTHNDIVIINAYTSNLRFSRDMFKYGWLFTIA